MVEIVAPRDPSEISILEGIGSRRRPLEIEISRREEESKVRGSRRLGQGGATVGVQGTETDEEWRVECKASCSGHGGNRREQEGRRDRGEETPSARGTEN